MWSVSWFLNFFPHCQLASFHFLVSFEFSSWVCLFSNTLPKAQKNLTPNQKSKQKKTLESQIPILVTCRLGDEILQRSEIFPVGYINELRECVASIYACSGLFQARFRGFHIFSGQVTEKTTTKRKIKKPQGCAKWHFYSSATAVTNSSLCLHEAHVKL